ncbi:hypothetical protein l11_10320 [Neisseria weaveri LMG 5135]|nr:hypothetical protein l13_14780 [Neisseria weaveri ATCC 51223]EGV37791.1 hypothetical protein l11_10320 [Neisseria weaveri LMG 5135]
MTVVAIVVDAMDKSYAGRYRKNAIISQTGLISARVFWPVCAACR